MNKLAIALTLATFLFVTNATAEGADSSDSASKSIKKVGEEQFSKPVSSQSTKLVSLVEEKDYWKQADSRLNEIETGVTFLKGKANESNLIPTILGVLGAIIGATIGAFAGGWFSLKNQKEQNKFEVTKSLIDWKIKQLSELYGPLYALSKQSTALYRHMNGVLSREAPEQFKLVKFTKSEDGKKVQKIDILYNENINEITGEEEISEKDGEPVTLNDKQIIKYNLELDKIDPDGRLFQIKKNGKWVNFRTVTDIDEAYGKDYGIEKYFDEIIDIGERMVKIIEEKAGYVRHEQTQLSEIFGRYLAHYSVLRQLHHERKKSLDALPQIAWLKKQSEMKVDKTAAFPRVIQKLVKEGYDDLNKEIEDWSNQGNSLDGKSK